MHQFLVRKQGLEVDVILLDSDVKIRLAGARCETNVLIVCMLYIGKNTVFKRGMCIADSEA